MTWTRLEMSHCEIHSERIFTSRCFCLTQTLQVSTRECRHTSQQQTRAADSALTLHMFVRQLRGVRMMPVVSWPRTRVLDMQPGSDLVIGASRTILLLSEVVLGLSGLSTAMLD